MLDRLKALGIGLSCDDFGTGYSSLSYLRRLPFDTLKVDRSFLQAGLETDRGSVILDAIILLAHDLGLQVVAEGVETQDQLNHLLTLECDLAQGFLIGEPIDAQQVLEALGAPSRGTSSSHSGIASLWNRLTRRQPVAPAAPVAVEPELEPEVGIRRRHGHHTTSTLRHGHPGLQIQLTTNGQSRGRKSSEFAASEDAAQEEDPSPIDYPRRRSGDDRELIWIQCRRQVKDALARYH